jgi:hypothetical protein
MTHQEIIEKLKGKKIYGFEFKGVGATPQMKNHVGKIGVITELHGKHPEYTLVDFDKGDFYYYPTSQLEEHLVDEEPIDINALFNQISKL